MFFLLVLVMNAAGVDRQRGEHPPLLEAAPGCTLWVGSAIANDPSIRLSVRLCPRGDQLTGSVQWSSLNSGWNVRDVAGRWQGGKLSLQDTAIVEERPNPGWRFCTIDRYTLHTVSPTTLIGEYTSAECTDRAHIQLIRQDAPG